ncbi:MAG: hypothetical protein BWY85_00242 [Firmicutes bacterium ADurb.Bin506]|nr:MAG: hypothetical protein BWY85_00242 [Firmicutes bacterium ADurb.Bin506]
MERNKTIRIDPETMDIPLDAEGNMELIYGDETTAQCVRLTLLTWLKGFPLDETHGTDYERVLGRKRADLEDDEVDEVIRDAVFQEGDVAQIDALETDKSGRSLSVGLTATLYSGRQISMEVTA